jgi:hypothetical protein
MSKIYIKKKLCVRLFKTYITVIVIPEIDMTPTYRLLFEIVFTLTLMARNLLLSLETLLHSIYND